MVFAALLVLTLVTVGVSYIHLESVLQRTLLALVVAGAKGTLVAMVFMHLNHERPFIYLSLALTAAFFVLLFALPMWTEGDHIVGTRADKWSAGMAAPQTPPHSPAAH
jgi:caa(3)-type oxidase subunit IV